MMARQDYSQNRNSKRLQCLCLGIPEVLEPLRALPRFLFYFKGWRGHDDLDLLRYVMVLIA